MCYSIYFPNKPLIIRRLLVQYKYIYIYIYYIGFLADRHAVSFSVLLWATAEEGSRIEYYKHIPQSATLFSHKIKPYVVSFYKKRLGFNLGKVFTIENISLLFGPAFKHAANIRMTTKGIKAIRIWSPNTIAQKNKNQ